MAVSVERWVARLMTLQPDEQSEILPDLSRVELETVVMHLTTRLRDQRRILVTTVHNYERDICEYQRATRRRWWQFWRLA